MARRALCSAGHGGSDTIRVVEQRLSVVTLGVADLGRSRRCVAPQQPPDRDRDHRMLKLRAHGRGMKRSINAAPSSARFFWKFTRCEIRCI